MGTVLFIFRPFVCANIDETLFGSHCDTTYVILCHHGCCPVCINKQSQWLSSITNQRFLSQLDQFIPFHIMIAVLINQSCTDHHAYDIGSGAGWVAVLRLRLSPVFRT